MKVLVLTNKDHIDFVSKVIYPYNGYHDVLHNIHAYYEDVPYPFEHIESYDIGVSFMYQHKVPAREVNTHTWFNFHPAPLPEYKGRNLCYHAIMNGEKEFGATLHYMDENFDTGNIIDVIKFPIGDWWTAYDVSMFAIEYSKRLFEIYFPRILAGEVFPSIPNVGGSYYPKTEISDFIDIDYETVESFERKIRAITYKDFYPKIEIGGVRYKIVKDT